MDVTVLDKIALVCGFQRRKKYCYFEKSSTMLKPIAAYFGSKLYLHEFYDEKFLNLIVYIFADAISKNLAAKRLKNFPHYNTICIGQIYILIYYIL